MALGPGTLSSDRPLVLTDNFPAEGIPEVDLAGRDHVTYDLAAGDPACWFQARIGFRRGDQGERTCADFRRGQPGPTDNPLEREQARFVSFDFAGAVRPTGRLLSIGGALGWDVGFRGEIGLPCSAGWVEVQLASGSTPARVVALDVSGRTVTEAGMNGTALQTLTLTGTEIAAVHVVAPQDETVVARLCWICSDISDDEDLSIPLRGTFGGVTMTSTIATGRPGDVVTVELTADAMDAVWIGSGPAALIDLCFTTIRTSGRSGGWDVLHNVPYPLCLPVANPDYPCPNAPGSFVDAENTALDRIVYGSPTPWSGPPFAELHKRLEALVQGGPPPGGEAGVAFQPDTG